PLRRAMSFRSATVCLWWAALGVGALVGYIPVHWRWGRSRTMSLKVFLATHGPFQLSTIALLVLVKDIVPKTRLAFYTSYMFTEAVINGT
ncbi:hypothetical protein M0O54_20015, partial [Acinetobacter lactucae]